MFPREDLEQDDMSDSLPEQLIFSSAIGSIPESKPYSGSPSKNIHKKNLGL